LLLRAYPDSIIQVDIGPSVATSTSGANVLYSALHP